MDNINQILSDLHNSKEWKKAKAGLFVLKINETKRWYLSNTNAFGVELQLTQKINQQWTPMKGPKAWEGGYIFQINTASLRDSGMVGRNTTMAINPQIARALHNLYDKVVGEDCEYEFMKIIDYMKV